MLHELADAGWCWCWCCLVWSKRVTLTVFVRRRCTLPLVFAKPFSRCPPSKTILSKVRGRVSVCVCLVCPPVC
jgi:hypothetical protein